MPNRSTAAFLLSVLVLSLTFTAIPATGETYIHRSYSWQYNGIPWTWSIDIPLSLYNGYAEVSEFNRLSGRDNGYLVTTKDPFMQSIADSFRQAAQKEGYGTYDEASLVLAWVQSLPYTSDSATSPFDEFPRFPVETLYADGGDCEDTTYLYLTIMRIWGYGSIFISPEGHLAAGILGSNDLPGYYWEYEGKRYYYAETTGDGFQLGDIPDEFKGSARLYPITVEGYVPNSNDGTTTDQPSFVSSTLSNLMPYVLLFVAVSVTSVVAVALWEESKRRKMVMAQPIILNCSFCGEPIGPQAAYCSRCGKARA